MALAVLHIPFPQLFESSERGGRAPATAGLARASEASKTVKPFARPLTLGTAGIMVAEDFRGCKQQRHKDFSYQQAHEVG
jgi:hypothetical protein